MKTFLKISTFLAFFFLLQAGCASRQKPSFDYGLIENNVYKNSFFNLTVNVPQNWYITTKKQTEELKKLGEKLMTGNSSQMKEIIDANRINTATLLTIFRYPIGKPVKYNHNFISVAENVRDKPGVENGGDYLFHARKLLRMARIKYYIDDGEFEKTYINGKEYYIMDSYLDFMGTRINQRYYATMANGFCVAFICSYVDDNGLKDLVAIMNSVKFD